MELTSALTLEMLGKPFLLDKRIDLLKAIEEHGSISKAAKAVPMSYKSAWEAVDTMNSLSPEPIVCRETGGKDGGGTTITAYGSTLLENYALLKAEHGRFLERLSELTDIQSGTFKTIGRLAMQISARNQLQAQVLSIQAENVNAKIDLKLKSGQELTSVITREAVENLHLEVGETVTAIFKSNTVTLSTSGHTSDEKNRLLGKVIQIECDEVNTKVSVDIGNHDTIIAVLSTEQYKTLNIENGTDVALNIKANDVMIGK